MEQEKLLAIARADFYKKFTQTPEQAGFSIESTFNNQVIFFTTQEVFDAFIQAQTIIRKAITQIIFFVVVVATLIICFLVSLSHGSPLLTGAFVVAVIILCLTVKYVHNRHHFMYNQKERIYLKKGAILIYDGSSFQDISPKDIYPEAALF